MKPVFACAASTKPNTPRPLPPSMRSNDSVTQAELSGMASKMPFVGRSVQRLEDAPLVMGRGRFAADISFANQAHMRVVRSAHAHGRIIAIDFADARASAGVVAIWTAADVVDI